MEALWMVLTLPRGERLDLAEALLESIKGSFSDAVETCESCGTEHKVNWDEFQAKESAKAAITRIQRIRRLLPKEESDAVGD